MITPAKIIINIILLCAQDNKELTKPQCLEIYKGAESIIEQNFDVDLQLKRTVYKRHLWNTTGSSWSPPYDTLNQADEFFKQPSRNFSDYDLHLGILSAKPKDGSWGVFKDYGSYCVRSTAIVSAENSYFKWGKKRFALVLAHEIAHMLGAKHDHVPGSIMSTGWSNTDKPFFSEESKEQIKGCLVKL